MRFAHLRLRHFQAFADDLQASCEAAEGLADNLSQARIGLQKTMIGASLQVCLPFWCNCFIALPPAL